MRKQREQQALERQRLEDARRKVAQEADDARQALENERRKSEKMDHKKLRKLIKSSLVESFEAMLLNDTSFKVNSLCYTPYWRRFVYFAALAL